MSSVEAFEIKLGKLGGWSRSGCWFQIETLNMLNCLRPKIVSLLDPTLRPLLTMMPNSKRAQIYTVCSSDHDLSFGTLIIKIDAL